MNFSTCKSKIWKSSLKYQMRSSRQSAFNRTKKRLYALAAEDRPRGGRWRTMWPCTMDTNFSKLNNKNPVTFLMIDNGYKRQVAVVQCIASWTHIPVAKPINISRRASMIFGSIFCAGPFMHISKR